MIITVIRRYCQKDKITFYQIDKGIYRYESGCYFYEVIEDFFSSELYQSLCDTIFDSIELGAVLNINSIKQLGIGANKTNSQFKRQL